MAQGGKVEGWFRELDDNRLEIFLKARGVKIRSSGGREGMFELVEWFENMTGLRVENPKLRRPPRRGPRPMAGQLDMTELESAPSDELPGDYGGEPL